MINLPLNLKLALSTFDSMCRQERVGIFFDQEKAKELVIFIDKEMKLIEEKVHPLLPKRSPNKGELKKMIPPKKQFKKDGTPSAKCYEWFDEIVMLPDVVTKGEMFVGKKGNIEVVLPHHEPIITEISMTLSNQEQLKDYLVSMGWKPSLWNVKKDARGKPVRDEKGNLIKTTPKFHQNGNICPNLEALGEKVDFIKDVIRWLSLRNRRSVILNEEKGTGWLNHPRLKIDGRLPAGSSGLTPTKRQKHKTVVNLPKADKSVILGKEMRSLFIAPMGKKIVGWDASQLEARCEAHWTYKYDNGAYAKELLEGDCHTANALIFYGDAVVIGPDGKATDKTRNPSKNGKYALTYGASPPRLAQTLNIPLQKGQEVYDSFWENNTSLASLKADLERYWERTGKKYITSIDGSKVYTRSQHSLINYLFQSTGSKIMDLSWHFMKKWLHENNIPYKRVLYMHDEYQVEVDEEHADMVGKAGVESIEKAGKFFKFKVPLTGSYKIGNNLSETH